MASPMTAEQLRAELERIARWLEGEVCIVGDENGEAPATAHDHELSQAALELRALAARLSGMAAEVTDKQVDAACVARWSGRDAWERLPAAVRRHEQYLMCLSLNAALAASPEPPHG